MASTHHMAENGLQISPHRSVAFFAFLAVLMVVTSYLLLLLLAAICIYLPYLLLINTDTFQYQVLLLFLGGLGVAGALLWSLLPRRDKFDPPGPVLDRAAQPRLFAEIDQIAVSLNERSPSAVYLIGEPNASVADRGGILGFGSRRVMCIGLPLFSVLTVSELRAVLAHEFAHYYSGDTSLSPWVYRAHTTLIRSYKNIGELQEIGHIHLIRLMFSLAALIIQSYFTFFFRIINFISRKQEHRSDELACLIAGKRPAMRGLEKIHYAGFFWPIYWESEIEALLNRHVVPDIGEGFRRFLAAPSIVTFTQTGLSHMLKSIKTGPFDSHPPLAERLSAMEALNTKEHPSDDVLSSSLLLDQQALEFLFVEFKSPRVPTESLRHVDWDDVACLVTIPQWRSEIAKFGSLLLGKKAAFLPDLSKQVSEIGSRLPDPKGRLLTREQRTHNAARFFGIAVGLVLLEKGWQFHAQPGISEFRRGDESLDLFALVNQLVAGELSADDWVQKCSSLGIAEETLGILQTPSISPAPQ